MKNDIGIIQQEIQSTIRSRGNIGNYEIVRKIGEGSFSSVFLAEHVMTRHEVVLKSAEKFQLNLASEIANMSLLNHPHIVRLYEYIVTPDKVWLVLEYCGGQELFNHLVMSKVIKPSHACKLFAQLAGAVAYAHQLHCAHRDLKLENVLLDDEGNIKLGDFGFTRSYVPRTMLETVCGTECYMAPELLLHQKYNPEAADVWSLGVILYALIYGKLPFDEDNTAETVKKIVEEDPPFPHVQKGEFLVEIARKMLRKHPSQRPKVIEMLDDLKEPGKHQKHLLAKIKSNPESSYIFSSREERNVLKGMKALSINLHVMASSIVHHKCDPLHGLWYTALDRQRTLSKQAGDSGNTSVSALHRRKSKASIRSSKSLNSQKQKVHSGFLHVDHADDTTTDSNAFNVSMQYENDIEDKDAQKPVFIPLDSKQAQRNQFEQTLPSAVSTEKEPSASNPLQEETAPPLRHKQKLSVQSRINEFIERRSTGKSLRAMEKFVSALKLKRNHHKESLMSYYKPAIDERRISFSLGEVNTKSNSSSHTSSPLGISRITSRNVRSSTNQSSNNSPSYRRMSSPILDLGRPSPPSSRRHSTLSLASSTSLSISETPIKGGGSSTASNSGTPNNVTPSTQFVLNPITRQVSTYSQLSQVSQLSQSSIEPSQLLGDNSPETKSSNFRWPNTNAWKFAGIAQPQSLPSTSLTPPGTPIISRPRAARLITVKEKIPTKIEEGDDEADWYE